jgi:hypothetical protein
LSWLFLLYSFGKGNGVAVWMGGVKEKSRDLLSSRRKIPSLLMLVPFPRHIKTTESSLG